MTSSVSTGGVGVVATRALVKRYGATTALHGVDISVPRGAVYGLVGPNGAGKTTLLSILAGLRRPDSGSVELAIPRRRVGVMPDVPEFEPWLTAEEVVRLAATLAGTDPDAETMPALQRAGLADAARRAVGGFSRGMRQRLGLAAAMAGAPELLILDEPAAALDPAGRRAMLDLVASLRSATTVIFSSHILADVQEICDSIGVLRDGRLLYEGPLEELLVGRAAPAYDLRVVPPADDLVRALAAEPWVNDVEATGDGRVRVVVGSTSDAERGLPRVVAAAGVRLASMTPVHADLEHVFLELTG
jgi:ABC-2 type transport system ATP-binding protein